MKKVYSDEQLISLLGSPDTRQVDKAIGQLYRQHKDMVFRLIRRNSGTDQDAEEVFNDTLVGVWKSVRNNRYQPTARLKTYLYQIARFTWLKRLAQEQAFNEIILYDTEHMDVQYPIRGIDETYEMNERADAFWERVRALGGKCYDVLRAFAEGYTMQEIAIRFKISSADHAKTIKYNCLRQVGKPTD